MVSARGPGGGAKPTHTRPRRIPNVPPALDALRFDCVPYGALACGLTGTYQAQNAAVVITAIELLQKKGWRVSEQNIRDGLLLVRWPARFELLGKDPIFIADGGNHFTDYGIYEGMFLFFDLNKPFLKGRLSCYINKNDDEKPKYRVSDKDIDGYEHLGRLVVIMRNYEV